MKSSRLEAIRKLGEKLGNNSRARSLDRIAEATIVSLVESIYKSADSGDDRGDFAKGREQMGMHAIALLVGSDWRTIERILFGEENGD